VALALWDQMPRPPDKALRTHLRGLAEKDHLTVDALERALPRGAMVFQLPVVPFPEAGPRLQMSDYEHARLYLSSTHLRFSYGLLRSAEEYRWAEWVGALPAAEMIEQLNRAGFQAILLDRRAYADRGQSWIDASTRAGYPTVNLRENPDLELVSLQPAASKRLPDTFAVRLHEPWVQLEPLTIAATAHAVKGWFAPERADERTWRWATDRAMMGIWNNLTEPARFRVRAEVQVARPGALELSVANQPVWRATVADRAQLDITLELPAGSTLLEWRFAGKPVRVAGDPRRLGFLVEGLSVTPVP
jgi:phosphoglycerol transferase